MSALDKKIKKERKRDYKMYKKLFKARDIASKHINGTVRVSTIVEHYKKRSGNWKYNFSVDSVKSLSIDIYNKRKSIMGLERIPPPPVTKKASIKKLPEPPRPNLPPLYPR